MAKKAPAKKVAVKKEVATKAPAKKAAKKSKSETTDHRELNKYLPADKFPAWLRINIKAAGNKNKNK